MCWCAAVYGVIKNNNNNNNNNTCIELNGEDFSNKIESVNLTKCPRDHRLTNKAHLSAITVTNISQNFFYLQDGGKNQLA